jgi:hypothetical protein
MTQEDFIELKINIINNEFKWPVMEFSICGRI